MQMSDKWVRDTGLIFSLIFLFLAQRGRGWAFFCYAAILLLLLFIPNALKPFAYLWLKIAEVLGLVMNKVFFTLVFFVIITPIAYLRRYISGDMRDVQPHPERASAFHNRSGIITGKKMERPY